MRLICLLSDWLPTTGLFIDLLAGFQLICWLLFIKMLVDLTDDLFYWSDRFLSLCWLIFYWSTDSLIFINMFIDFVDLLIELIEFIDLLIFIQMLIDFLCLIDFSDSSSFYEAACSAIYWLAHWWFLNWLLIINMFIDWINWYSLTCSLIFYWSDFY